MGKASASSCLIYSVGKSHVLQSILIKIRNRMLVVHQLLNRLVMTPKYVQANEFFMNKTCK